MGERKVFIFYNLLSKSMKICFQIFEFDWKSLLDLEEPFNSTRKRRSTEDEKITYFDRTSKKISNFFDKSLKLLTLTENESDKPESLKTGRSPAEPSCRTLNTNVESSGDPLSKYYY